MLTSFMQDSGRGLAQCHRWEPDVDADTGDQTPACPMNIASANGLPLASYDYFIADLAEQYCVAGQDNRGAWPNTEKPARQFDWWQHCEDMAAFMRAEYSQPVIAVGHSIGATVSTMVALRYPELIRCVVLIDPATLPSAAVAKVAKVARHVPRASNMVPIVKSTRRRRAQWPSREDFATAMAKTGAYGRYSEVAMEAYAQAGLVPAEDGFELRFQPRWEAHNFANAPYLWPLLERLKCPALLLRAEHSELHREPGFSEHCAHLPNNIDVQTLAACGHLAVQENPQLVSGLIKTWLAEQAFDLVPIAKAEAFNGA